MAAEIGIRPTHVMTGRNRRLGSPIGKFFPTQRRCVVRPYLRGLAQPTRVCLSSAVVFHWLDRDSRRIAKRAFAGMLALLLLLTATLSVAFSFHKSLHHSVGATDQGCAVCLFAHGQVHRTDSAPPIVTGPTSSFEIALLSQRSTPPSVDYRLSPSRAPPLIAAV